MNGHHLSNGVPKGKSPLPQANGNVNVSTKGPTEQGPSTKAVEKRPGMVNGASAILPVPKSTMKMDELPDEILEIVRGIPPEAYVPMSRLIDRAAQSCWTDLNRILQELSTVTLRDPKTVTERIVGEVQTPNDASEENRTKKYKLWNFAENQKRALIKLLVLMQWSASTEENKVTIALNFYFHKLRAAFADANNTLDQWIFFIDKVQDAAPDLDTALEALAAGRISNLPNLGYVQERKSTPKELLATLRRLNNVLNIRMLSETDLPPPFTKWRVHDGRVTFSIPNEFDISLSVLSEEADAPFQVVDVNFTFRPTPVMSQDLLDQILVTLNRQLFEKGLDGAYQFLHDLTMTQKLIELHRQALNLLQGLWANNLRVELLRRTLVVQYWTRRQTKKSWIEITINSGRVSSSGGVSEYPVPYLHLRWLKHGRLVTEHDVHINLSNLSFEDILNEVTASHINCIFDEIYDKLYATTLYESGELAIEEQNSATDGADTTLSIELTKTQNMTVNCDPVGGELVISPAGDRANRLQAELRGSKNLVEDFVNRFTAFRCGVAQVVLSKAMSSSSWRSLPGRKPSLAEVRELFQPSASRAVFFRQKDWSEDWTLAASFGTDGDFWWLVCETKDAKRSVQKFRSEPIHTRRALPFNYFEALASHAATQISLQMLQQSAEKRGIKSVMPANSAGIRIHLASDEGLITFDNDCTIGMSATRKGSFNHCITVLVKSKAQKDTLRLLASTISDNSTTIHADRSFVRLEIGCLVGEDKMDDIMKQLHYLDDVTSCLRLIDTSPGLNLQRLTSEDIIIDYHTDPDRTNKLSFAFLFHPTESQSRFRLLPEGVNPHLLVNDEVRSHMSKDTPLFERLKALLEAFASSMMIVNSLQYLQGLITSEEVSEMGSLNMDETKKWLRIHVISRTMLTFAVHYFSKNPAFKHRDDAKEIPEKMLARLEIEPHFSQYGNKVAWIIRPAIEEFRSYTRPSFSSQELKQHLQDAIFSADNPAWIGEDNAVKVKNTNPYPAIIALHDAILTWLKEAVEKFKREPVPSAQAPAVTNTDNSTNSSTAPVQQTPAQSHPQPQTGTTTQAPNLGNLTPQQQQQLIQHRQAAARAQAQAAMQAGRGQGQRPQNMMNMQQGPNSNMNTNQTSRVMTAPPQQMRQMPPGAGRGRGQPGMNMHQGRPQQQQQNRPQPRDVINLD